MIPDDQTVAIPELVEFITIVVGKMFPEYECSFQDSVDDYTACLCNQYYGGDYITFEQSRADLLKLIRIYMNFCPGLDELSDAQRDKLFVERMNSLDL